MVAPQAVLAEHVQAAMAAAFGPEHARRDPAIRPSQYADFQANAALALAREVGLPPREGAARIVGPVGHPRTTIVGDSLAQMLELLGHRVVRQNHIGDWGTPFGMLSEHLLDVGEDSPEAALLGSDPNAFYQAARARFDASPEVAARA